MSYIPDPERLPKALLIPIPTELRACILYGSKISLDHTDALKDFADVLLRIVGTEMEEVVIPPNGPVEVLMIFTNQSSKIKAILVDDCHIMYDHSFAFDMVDRVMTISQCLPYRGVKREPLMKHIQDIHSLQGYSFQERPRSSHIHSAARGHSRHFKGPMIMHSTSGLGAPLASPPRGSMTSPPSDEEKERLEHLREMMDAPMIDKEKLIEEMIKVKPKSKFHE